MAGATSAWGVDVGASSLKALKLRRDGDGVKIEAFDLIEHEKFLSETGVNRDEMIRSTLQKFVAKHALKRDTVYVGVPGSSAFARFVKLPPVETKKIPEIVRFEAVQQVPFPLEQVNWDFHTFQSPDSPDVEVGIFAMKKELVAQVMANFRSVNMLVQGVQMSPLAVYNAAAYDGMTGDKGTVVIDMGAEHTDIVIMDQGRLWMRTINTGGNQFTDALAKSFKQTFSKAEAMKKTAATSKYQKQIYQAMRPIFSDLVAEIQRSIGHYNSGHRDSRLERIVGMGSPFKLPNLQKYLQQELKMEFVRLESYNRANVEKAAAFSENILSMTAAYGLAIQALGYAPIDTSLLPPEVARTMMWRKKQPWFVGAAALVAVGALAMAGQWWLARAAYASTENEAKRSANDAAISQSKLQVDKWSKVNNTFTDAQKQVDAEFKLVESRKVWPMVMNDIWSALPQAAAAGVGRGPQPPQSVVITAITSDYTGKLSAEVLGGGGPGAAAPVAGAPAPAGGGDPNAPVTPPGVIGESDHGFIITLTGYTPPTTPPYAPVTAYRDALIKLAPVVNKDKPYYYSSPTYSGGLIAGPAGGAGAPFGGGRMGGGAFGGSGGSAPGATPEKAPWGSVKGPYWDIFVPELVNITKPAQPTTPGGMDFGAAGGATGSVELPYPVDMVAPRTPGAQPKQIAGSYGFTMKFKVHVK